MLHFGTSNAARFQAICIDIPQDMQAMTNLAIRCFLDLTVVVSK